ncbi:MAG: lysophospholipid acyltransferase family protein [Clostridia bacterium]|jgi:1-acyl-sn-glycerol-3-phosphate acyltransferase|nr:1-acylglycerol-3-phosphate O-acyltransferase [Clostridium sp. CAG:798]HBJ11904.1 1-acyl-sn-glycerol-3-phosphate acyltransferase [Clostridiales bacterium]
MLRKIIVFLVYIFNVIVFRVKCVGQENIQNKGAYIICANHTSNWDAPILVSNLKRKVYVMAKAELFKNKFIKWLGDKCCVFPVKRGMRDIESIKYSLKLLKDGEILVIFPEGTRKGLEKNGKAQNGVAYMAIRTGVPVIPVGIQGEMKPFRKVKLNIGEPLDFSQYKSNKPEKEILDKVSKEIMDNIIMLTNENI